MAVKKAFEKVPENTLILGADKYYSMDGKVTHVNNNVLIVGRTGSGKTRYVGEPNLLQCNGSYVISDPKGMLRKKYEKFFRAKGYEVYAMDFIHPERSSHYNPISKLCSTNDVKKMAHLLTYSSEPGHYRGSLDPYWDEMTETLFMSIIGYLYETDDIPKSQKNMKKLIELAYLCNRERGLCSGRSADRTGSKMALVMEAHEEKMRKKGKNCWSKKQFDKVDSAPDKTYQTIISTLFSKVSRYDSEELLKLLSRDEIQFKSIGKKPTILFVEVSDIDRSTDDIVNLFYTQLMNELCMYADDKCPGGCLPIPVQFILDDFATNCRIDNFENMISNIRARGISTILMIQSESQLYAGYGESAQTIVDNCSSYLYLGGSNYKSAEIAAMRANKPVYEILNMPVDTCWLFRVGEKPAKVDFLDIETFQIQKGCVPFEEPVEPRELP